MGDTTKQYYEKEMRGQYALVEIERKDKQAIDAVVTLLRKLEVHEHIDMLHLKRVWKQYDRVNVRKFMK